MADAASLMAKHAKAFKAAEIPDRTPVPDGAYQFKLYRTPGKAIIVKDSDGAWRARIGLEVVAAADEKCIGKKTTKSWNLFTAEETPDERGFSYLKGDLKIIGIDAENLELTQLAEALESLTDGETIIDAQVQTKQVNGIDRSNTWFRGLASEAPKAKAGAKPGKPARKF